VENLLMVEEEEAGAEAGAMADHRAEAVMADLHRIRAAAMDVLPAVVHQMDDHQMVVLLRAVVLQAEGHLQEVTVAAAVAEVLQR
jgi:hypothetical protein